MTTTTTTYTPPPTASRPLGVAILAVLIGIYGFIVFLLGLLIAVGSTILPSSTTNAFNPFHAFESNVLLAGLIVLIVGLIILGLAVGLWHLRMWALVLTILFLLFEIVTSGLAGQFISFTFIVAVLLVIYLVAVSRHFS